MNPFDIVIIIIVGFCLIRGFFRGLVKELSSIIGVLGGFYAAYTYYREIAKFLSKWVSNTSYVNIISFMLIFCLVFILISILGIIIKYILNIAFLGWVDRICGAGFGIIKSLLIVSVLFVMLTSFLPQGAPMIKESFLAPHVAIVAESLAKAVPKHMKNQFETKIAELKKAWKK